MYAWRIIQSFDKPTCLDNSLCDGAPSQPNCVYAWLVSTPPLPLPAFLWILHQFSPNRKYLCWRFLFLFHVWLKLDSCLLLTSSFAAKQIVWYTKNKRKLKQKKNCLPFIYKGHISLLCWYTGIIGRLHVITCTNMWHLFLLTHVKGLHRSGRSRLLTAGWHRTKRLSNLTHLTLNVTSTQQM